MRPLSRPGLFLDLDGTLADSIPVLRQVYAQFLGHFGHEGSDNQFDRLNGLKLTEIIAVLKSIYRLAMEHEDLLELYNDLVDRAYTKVMPYPNSFEAIAAAYQNGWVIMVVTSNLAARTKAWLAQNQFSSYLTGVVTGEEVHRGKPWPDLYELAQARAATVQPLSLAIEDSTLGVQAAQAAGLRAITFAPDAVARLSLTTNTELMTNWSELNRFLDRIPGSLERRPAC
jgi:HAD superfamily hydrolase (TIGR01509 family)